MLSEQRHFSEGAAFCADLVLQELCAKCPKLITDFHCLLVQMSNHLGVVSVLTTQRRTATTKKMQPCVGIQYTRLPGGTVEVASHFYSLSKAEARE